MMQKNTCGLCERRRTEKEHLIILHKRSRLIARLRAPPLTHRSSFLPLLMQLPLSPFLLILLLLSSSSLATPLSPLSIPRTNSQSATSGPWVLFGGGRYVLGDVDYDALTSPQ